MNVAAGIIIASIPYFLLKFGWKLSEGDSPLDKIVALVMMLSGIGGAIFIVLSANS